MKKINNFLFIFSIFLFIFLIFLFLSNNLAIDSQEFYTSVEISKKNVMGLDVNGTALKFGRISRGGSSTRNIIFYNDYGFPVLVETEVSGDISSFLSHDPTSLVNEGETKKITFSVIAPRDQEVGFYEGIVKLKIKPV